MDFPLSISQKLASYLTISTEEALFAALTNKIDDLILFFESVSEDETWTENHEGLMKKIVDWLTNQAAGNLLSKNHCRRAAEMLQIHEHFFKYLLPKNIQIKLKDGEILFNGLLLIASSDFFKQILLSESGSKEKNVLIFPQLTIHEFLPIEAFITTGGVPNLATKGENDLIDLIKHAKAWDLQALEMKCEQMLYKYLTMENVLDRLFLAKQERWRQFEQSCIHFINKSTSGFRLSADNMERLAFEFLDFQESTLSFFDKLQPIITDIICTGSLIDQPQFGAILKKSKNLFGLDISGTLTFSIQLQEIPKGLKALNLSECPWVSKDILKRFFDLCPDLSEIALRHNIHLNYLFWGELSRYAKIKKLDLSFCTQILDDDLILLLKGLKGLTELSLNGCKKINEKGFLELAKSLQHLVRLDLSHSSVSDTALVEIVSRCRFLTTLDISSCQQVTEKGVFALIKSSTSLQELNLSRCRISSETVNEIKEAYPSNLSIKLA